MNEDTIYWIEQEAGTIRRASLDGEDVETLFGGLQKPEYLALSFETTRILSTDASKDLPTEYRLYDNYPNPFNPSTTIRYELPEHSAVELSVYDVMGRKVKVLVDEPQPAGAYSVVFDASHLPSGMYIYRLETETKILTNTMLLLK